MNDGDALSDARQEEVIVKLIMPEVSMKDKGNITRYF